MELNYKEFGQGDPIIILHGLFGTSDNWQTIAKKLAKDYLSPSTNKQSQLDQIRDKLEQNRFKSALFDTKKWVKSFEIGISKVWKSYEKGQPADNVESVEIVDL